MQIAKIRLSKPRRVLFARCDEVPLKRDEACIIKTELGLEWGACILPPEPCDHETGNRTGNKVVRAATTNDFKTRDSLIDEEKKAREVCLQRIKKRELDMKLVDVDFTFDKHHVIFYFTAEDRVDFRELVRDLAHELRTRIELRHIQVRDEAKLVGGIGTCGRELCCSTWLNEFKPISMRMAKRQNLSLNPSKISGQCGRLLCCLSYENALYEEQHKKRKAANQQAKKEIAPPQEADKPKDRPIPADKPVDTPQKQAPEKQPQETAQTRPAEQKNQPQQGDERNQPRRGGKRRRRGRNRKKDK